MWQKVATEMGIPWRSAESMHWQLGEQEMSARANAPVFQLHPSATGVGSPTQAHVAPSPHGFTPTNASQLVPNPPQPLPPQHQQHQQPPPPPPPGSAHSYHQRTESNSSQGRRRNSSFSRRRTDARSRSSVPPQLGPTLPQIQPTSEADLMSGPRTTPLETHSGVKREGEVFMEPFQKRRREDDAGGLRADPEARSPGGRSPDRSSQRSGTGSVKSMKSVKREELDEPPAQASNEPPPSTT